MPYLTDAQLAKVQNTVASLQNKASLAKARAEAKAGEIKDGLEVVGGAALMGYLRGYWEKSEKSFVVPGTSIDLELCAGIALAGAGLVDVVGPYDTDAMMLGFGMLAHYSGQVARNWGKTGEFALVAGNDVPQFVPGYGPVAGEMDSLLSGMGI